MKIFGLPFRSEKKSTYPQAVAPPHGLAGLWVCGVFFGLHWRPGATGSTGDPGRRSPWASSFGALRGWMGRAFANQVGQVGRCAAVAAPVSASRKVVQCAGQLSRRFRALFGSRLRVGFQVGCLMCCRSLFLVLSRVYSCRKLTDPLCCNATFEAF